MVIQEAYSQRPIADNPIPVVLWRQPHWLTPESLAEVDLIPSPLDLSVGADLPHRHSDLVVRSRYPAGIGPERRTVPIPRTGLPQSLMRSLFIVAVAKGVKGSLLPSSVRLRRRSRLYAPAQLGPVCSLPCWAPANALVARPFEAMPPPSSAPTLDGPAWPRSAARLSPEASHWDDYAELGYGLPAHSTHTSGIAGAACSPSYDLCRIGGTPLPTSLSLPDTVQ